jgi:hypothetical protein
MLTHRDQPYFALQCNDEGFQVSPAPRTLNCQICFRLCSTPTSFTSRNLRVATLCTYVRFGELCLPKGTQVITLDVNLILNILHRPIAHREPQGRGAIPYASSESEVPHAIGRLTVLPQIIVTVTPRVIIHV